MMATTVRFSRANTSSLIGARDSSTERLTWKISRSERLSLARSRNGLPRSPNRSYAPGGGLAGPFFVGLTAFGARAAEFGGGVMGSSDELEKGGRRSQPSERGGRVGPW